MHDPTFLSDLAFITDITNHLNELNLNLQGKQQNIANLYGHLNGYESKLKLFKLTLANDIFTFFPYCKEHFEEPKNFDDISFSIHVKYIEIIIEVFKNRFGDFKEL